MVRAIDTQGVGDHITNGNVRNQRVDAGKNVYLISGRFQAKALGCIQVYNAIGCRRAPGKYLGAGDYLGISCNRE